MLSPSNAVETVKMPKPIPGFKGVALRTLVLGETSGAAIDASGDLYQFGDGFEPVTPLLATSEGGGGPKLTLRGKDLVDVKLAGEKVYALSSSGHIYILSQSRAKQGVVSGRRTSDGGWFGWLVGPGGGVDHVQMNTDVKLANGET